MRLIYFKTRLYFKKDFLSARIFGKLRRHRMSRPKPIKAIHSDYYKQISYNLKYFRTVREITQAELATLANTSEKYISQIESLT